MSDRHRVESDPSSDTDSDRRHEVATVVRLPTTVTSDRADSAEALSHLLRLVSAKEAERLRSVARMAEGGMGQIHLAVDQVLHRRVAKKVINPDLKNDLMHARMFVREAQIISQLDHPSIVPVHDMGVDEEGRLYFTMKLVRGRTLTELIRELPEGPIAPSPLFSLLEIVIKVCDALSLAHSRGVVHCDVKPANIMVGDYGEVYLMDWGVAQLMPDGDAQLSSPETPGGDESAKSDTPSAGIEEEAISIGTLGYMSPEQILCQSLTPATDIFCLGGVLYEIVTRKAPYSGFSMTSAMTRVQKADFVPPDEVVDAEHVPPGLRRIIMTAMAAAPEERFSSAEAFKQEVLRFTRGDAAFERRTFPAGSFIVMEGDSGNCAYIVESGNCDVFRVVKGERVTLGTLGPGDVFGEMAVLSPGPRTANVVATDDVVAQVVHGDVLKRELDSMRPWMGLVVRRLADRLREDGTTPAKGDSSNASIAQHVTMYLCTWGQRGPGRSLACDLEDLVRAIGSRLGCDSGRIREALEKFPGFQVDGAPLQVTIRDPKTTLGALWRADEKDEDVSNATHRELAEQIAMFLCTWGRLDASKRLGVSIDTLCRELAPRIGGKEEVLFAAISDFPELEIDSSTRAVMLAEPKRLLERLWPAADG